MSLPSRVSSFRPAAKVRSPLLRSVARGGGSPWRLGPGAGHIGRPLCRGTASWRPSSGLACALACVRPCASSARLLAQPLSGRRVADDLAAALVMIQPFGASSLGCRVRLISGPFGLLWARCRVRSPCPVRGAFVRGSRAPELVSNGSCSGSPDKAVGSFACTCAMYPSTLYELDR